MKKIVIFVSNFLFLSSVFCQTTQNILCKLCLSALENNSDIQTAENTYKNAEISRKNAGGAFIPTVSFATSTILPNEDKWDICADNFSSSITYNQPLLGGTVIGITGAYSFTASDVNDERLILQNPRISFSVSQSLFPFWTQGKLLDPTILSQKKQSEYYYNQLIYTKRNIINNIVQNFISAYIDNKKIQIYKNHISFVQNQIDAFLQMKNQGESNNSQIYELQNKKWSYQQDLISIQQSRQNSINSIENLCGYKFFTNFYKEDFFDINFDDLEPNNFCNFINNLCNGSFDPCEKALNAKIETLEAKCTQEKQASAPVMNFSIQPSWTLDTKKVSEWNKAWDSNTEGSKPANWTIGFGIDFSPLLSAGINKNVKRTLIELNQAYQNYDSYLRQKEFIHNQYTQMLEFYLEQKNSAKEILNNSTEQFFDISLQYKNGEISYQDYFSAQIQMQNNSLFYECAKALVWMYSFELLKP